jgi:hypothetical protein
LLRTDELLLRVLPKFDELLRTEELLLRELPKLDVLRLGEPMELLRVIVSVR